MGRLGEKRPCGKTVREDKRREKWGMKMRKTEEEEKGKAKTGSGRRDVSTKTTVRK